MKTDPDFHPVATAWLEGRASQPEHGILREILSGEPGVMREFATLCHTEVLLQQSGADTASRRESLEKLMSGTPLPRRAADLWKKRITRWSAAAALLTVAAWAMMSPTNDSDASSVAGKQSPSNATVRKAVGGGKTSIKAEAKDQFPEAAPECELLLKRFYITDFKAAGPLPEAVALLVKDIKTADGKPPEVEVLDAGDTPISLALNVSLPAWTLLQIMALQSGTAMQLTGQTIIFQSTVNPADRIHSTTQSSDSNFLRALLSPTQNGPATEDSASYSNLAHRAFGSRLAFSGTTRNQTEYTGPARDIEVLKLALGDISQPSVRVFLTMKLLSLHPQFRVHSSLDTTDEDGFSLAGIYKDFQFQCFMRSVSQKKGVDLMTVPSIIAFPNLYVSAGDNYSSKKREPLPITARVVVRPSGQNMCSLLCEIGMLEDPEIAGSRAIPVWKSEILLWDGQTAIFGRSKQADGGGTLFCITANLMDSAGQLINPDRDSGSSVPVDHLPDAIPLPWPGELFISPFASAEGEIDLTNVKSGEQVKCPFTGKLFRKP